MEKEFLSKWLTSKILFLRGCSAR